MSALLDNSVPENSVLESPYDHGQVTIKNEDREQNPATEKVITSQASKAISNSAFQNPILSRDSGSYVQRVQVSREIFTKTVPISSGIESSARLSMPAETTISTGLSVLAQQPTALPTGPTTPTALLSLPPESARPELSPEPDLRAGLEQRARVAKLAKAVLLEEATQYTVQHAEQKERKRKSCSAAADADSAKRPLETIPEIGNTQSVVSETEPTGPTEAPPMSAPNQLPHKEAAVQSTNPNTASQARALFRDLPESVPQQSVNSVPTASTGSQSLPPFGSLPSDPFLTSIDPLAFRWYSSVDLTRPENRWIIDYRMLIQLALMTGGNFCPSYLALSIGALARILKIMVERIRDGRTFDSNFLDSLHSAAALFERDAAGYIPGQERQPPNTANPRCPY